MSKIKPEPSPDDPMLDRSDLAKMGIKFHPSHLRRLWGRDQFPRPVKISERKLVWRKSAITEWLANKICAATTNDAGAVAKKKSDNEKMGARP